MIESVTLLNPQPGDVIVATISSEFPEEAEAVADALTKSFPGTLTVVLQGVELTKLSAGEFAFLARRMGYEKRRATEDGGS